MEIDEAIKACIEAAEEREGMCRVNKVMGTESYNDELMKCAVELRQVAEWLKELKERREIMDFIDSNVRVIETNDGVMIRFGGGNVCEWARRKGER